MHAVIVQVTIDPSREEAARGMLREVVVPSAAALPGFAGGTWMRALDGDAGRGVLLFEEEGSARAAAERIRSEGPPPEAPVRMESVEAFEVPARA